MAGEKESNDRVDALGGSLQEVANQRVFLHLDVIRRRKPYAEVKRRSLREAADAHAWKRAHLCEEDDVGDSIRSGDIDVILQAVRSGCVKDSIQTYLRSVRCDAVFGAIIIRKFLTSSCTVIPTDPLRATMLWGIFSVDSLSSFWVRVFFYA